MRLIDADALTDRMYHDAFETDTDMQKWDSGCWIRYKMFENAIDEAPTIEPIEWIPCSERLPEKYGEYLITATYIDKPYVTTDEYFSYGWDDWEEVTAWAERPKPWKGKNDE